MRVTKKDTSMAKGEAERSSLPSGARQENQQPQNGHEADTGAVVDYVDSNCESAGLLTPGLDILAPPII